MTSERGIAIRLDGLDEVTDALGDALDVLENFEPVFEDIGRMLVASTQERFEREVGPDGNPWPKSLRALMTGGKTLTDTAHLKNSITFEASDDRLAVGTDVIYAAIHQLGGVITPINGDYLTFWVGLDQFFTTRVEIPERPFLGIDSDDSFEIEGILGRHLKATVT